MYSTVVGEIPTLDLKHPEAKINEEVLQKFGSADFRQVLQRNIEKDFIERTAAGITVANESAVFQSVNNLYTIMETSSAGGVKVQFPIDGPSGNTGNKQANGPLVPKTVVLDKANSTYGITHEAMLDGGDPAENDMIVEAAEQLGYKYDDQYISELISKKYAGNNVNGSAWLGAGDPFDDINTAINNIISNSAINPNAKRDNWFTCIVPIEYRVALEKITIVDGLKIGLSELIAQRLKCQILYTRSPFNLEAGETASLVDQAIVIPTKDRHVGKFYTFNGGDLPNTFVTVDENGKRVSTNTWAKFAVTPSEADGSLTENRRIAEIDTINA